VTAAAIAVPDLTSRTGIARTGPAAFSAVPDATSATAPTLAPPIPSSWVVRPFANTEVSLGPSLFTANRDRILTYARSYPVDRVLAVFRANAGLDTLGAQPPGGWETFDGNLRGHYAGHFLSCLALAYAGSGESLFKERLDTMVSALGQCQDALAATVGGRPIGRVPGRLGNAVKLAGASQHVALPAGILNGLSDATIALWVNPAAITTWSRCFDFGTGALRRP
jgi:hypothetical protein